MTDDDEMFGATFIAGMAACDWWRHAMPWYEALIGFGGASLVMIALLRLHAAAWNRFERWRASSSSGAAPR